jgi:hypothetical protein
MATQAASPCVRCPFLAAIGRTSSIAHALQVPVSERTWGFNSPLAHHLDLRGFGLALSRTSSTNVSW